MRIAAIAFFVFTAILVITVIAAIAFNPLGHELAFVLQAVVTFGIMAVVSAIAARQLWMSNGTWVGYTLVSLLTVIIVAGWMKYGSLQLDEPIHPILNVLRTIDGLYVLFLWCVLIRASILARQSGLAN